MVKQILDCKDYNMVTNTDKNDLKDDIQCPLERGPMKHLLQSDPELIQLRKQASKNNIAVYIERLFYSFGQMNYNNQEIARLSSLFTDFSKHNNDAIFVILLGVTSHWVTIVLHKERRAGITLYLLDSSNLPILNCLPQEISALYDLEMHQDIEDGRPLKTFDHFSTKMVLHSLFDIRHFLMFFQELVHYKIPLYMFHSSQKIQSRFKHLWDYTHSLRGSKGSIIPRCPMTVNERTLKLNEKEVYLPTPLMRCTDLQIKFKPKRHFKELFKPEWSYNDFSFPYFTVPKEDLHVLLDKNNYQ